jgi:CRP-like cAMP-binding protein
MNNIESLAVPLWSGHVARGTALLQAHTRGPAWRVTQGVFCVEHPSAQGVGVIQLALPGDVVGVESWCHLAYAHTVTALTGGHAQPEAALTEADRAQALAATVLQQQRQMADMVSLRSGPVQARLERLLHMLNHRAGSRALALSRKHLPALKDLARVVDSTPETVCRELNRLLPAAAKPADSASPSWLRAVSPFAPAC